MCLVFQLLLLYLLALLESLELLLEDISGDSNSYDSLVLTKPSNFSRKIILTTLIKVLLLGQPHPDIQGILGPLILLIATVLSILFTTTGLIFVFENSTMNPIGQVDNLFSSLYFIVTISFM